MTPFVDPMEDEIELRRAIRALPATEHTVLVFALREGWVSPSSFSGARSDDHGRRAAVAIGRLVRMGALVREPSKRRPFECRVHGWWAIILSSMLSETTP